MQRHGGMLEQMAQFDIREVGTPQLARDVGFRV